MRDPRIDPRDGDVLSQAGGELELLVDGIHRGQVLYRVVSLDGGLLAAYRVTLRNWRESAPYCCELSWPGVDPVG